MRTFLYVIGTFAALATLTFFTLGVWTGDARWAGTSFISLVAAGASFCAAPEFPTHNERCSGC